MAKPGDRLVGAFALRVGGRGTHDSEALLAGISTRLRAEGDWEPWQVTTRVAPPRPPAAQASAEGSDRRLWVVGGLLVLMGLLWAGRRRLRRAG